MSECVVRMEMPKHCGECELKTWDIWPGSFKCVKTMHDIMSHIRNRTKPNDCPILCQIPDGHGDLINREYVIGTACSGLTRTEDGEKWIRVHEVRESIKSAPIIVPAERSET